MCLSLRQHAQLTLVNRAFKSPGYNDGQPSLWISFNLHLYYILLITREKSVHSSKEGYVNGYLWSIDFYKSDDIPHGIYSYNYELLFFY